MLWHLRTPLAHWLGTTRVESGCLTLAAVFSFLGLAFTAQTVEETSLGNGLVVAEATPIFAALLALAFLGEPWLPAEMAAAAAAVLGCFLLFEHEIAETALGGGRRDDLGLVLALIGSLCGAAAICMTRLMGTSVVIPWPKLIFAQVTMFF